jgi:hypothetical protein
MKQPEDMGYLERELFLMGYAPDEAEKLAAIFQEYAAAGGRLDACFALARDELDRRWREGLTAKPWWRSW